MNKAVLAAILCVIVLHAPFVMGELSLQTMTDWHIVCADDAIESEAYAAEEFQTLFRELTGTELPIVASRKQDGGVVFIGPDAVAQSGRYDPLCDPGAAAFR